MSKKWDEGSKLLFVAICFYSWRWEWERSEM